MEDSEAKLHKTAELVARYVRAAEEWNESGLKRRGLLGRRVRSPASTDWIVAKGLGL